MNIRNLFTKYLINKNVLIVSSKYQTKQWRKNQVWYISGKKNECEKYQIKQIEQIIDNKLNRTDDRINIELLEIIQKRTPLKDIRGFEWTENFDGKIIKNNNIVYFNLKFICDFGGVQTRALRETYYFIKYQLEYNNKYKDNNIYFINILDGDGCYKYNEHFKYLINKFDNKKIFCGDMNQFNKYYNINF
jgi:hypothetical protein